MKYSFVIDYIKDEFFGLRQRNIFYGAIHWNYLNKKVK